MNAKTINYIIFLTLLLIASCQSISANSSSCASLVSDISLDRLNIDLILSSPYKKSSYSIKEDLVFLADNYSKSVLEISPDKDLEIYLQDASGWVQIRNNLNYLSQIDRIGVKSSDNPGGTTYNVFYDTSLIQKPTKLCVILRAIKDPDNAHTNIASYIEIVITP